MEDEKLFPSFDVDIEGILQTVSRNGYTKVLLQGPEGLKRGLVQLAEIIEDRTMSLVWVDGDPCYGACDHAGERAKVLGADALIHLGHSDIPSMERGYSVPIHFFPLEMRTEMEMIHGGLGKIINKMAGMKVSFFTTIQHMSLLNEVRGRLREAGIKVHIGDPGEREELPGQVIGCSFSAAKGIPEDVDTLLFLGTGRFHPLGLALSSGREVHTMDPLTGEVGVVGKEEIDKMLRSRFGHINSFKDRLLKKGIVGIIIGFKPGQRRTSLAECLIDLLRERKIRSKMIIMDHMDPMKLKALGIDLVVSTACPRIAMDDSIKYTDEGITILTPVELRIALGILSWSDFTFDEEW